MLQKIITRLLRHRHPWRELEFSQLAELYSAVSLRMLAQNLVGIFIPVYLYKIGYSLPDVLLFFVFTYAATIIADLPIGWIVARFGPKHSMLAGNLVQIVVLLLLVTQPDQRWLLILPAIAYGVARGLFFIPYNVDFSKILHPDHGGKELGFMTNLQQLANVIGPLAGGAIALFIGARYTLIAGIVLFALAAVPLFASAEPVTRQRSLNFNGLFKKPRWPDYVSYFGYSGQLKILQLFWPLFLALTIFAAHTYFKLGIILSISAGASLFTTLVIGRLVDKHRGGQLLKYSTISSAVIDCLLPLITGFGGALAVTMANQSLASGFEIPFGRGMYDTADSLEGQRITYITVMEMFSEVGNLALVAVVWLLSLALAPVLSLQLGFIIAAGFALLLLTQRFPALAPHDHLPLKFLASLRVK